MKVILQEDIPRWYGLSWQAKPPRLLLSLHHRLLEEAHSYKEDDETIQSLLKEFKLSRFNWDFREGFGFDDAIQLVDENKDFKIFEAKLPKVFQMTDEVCEDCNGTGRDDLRDAKCLFCEGKKKKHEYVWEPAFAISVSLNLVMRPAFYFQGQTDAVRPQLFCVQLYTAHGMHGGELGGMYSIPLVRWLKGHQGRVTEMEDAMRKAYTHMLRADYLDNFSFRASVENTNGWLNISCPGNACGLHPHDQWLRDGRGYEFSSHNVDSPVQQLTLLTGLSALHDKVDKEL